MHYKVIIEENINAEDGRRHYRHDHLIHAPSLARAREIANDCVRYWWGLPADEIEKVGEAEYRMKCESDRTVKAYGLEKTNANEFISNLIKSHTINPPLQGSGHASISFSVPTTALGRNGEMQSHGLIATQLKTEVILQPVTSKNAIGRCYICIPTQDVGLFCDNLKAMVAVEEPAQEEATEEGAAIKAYLNGGFGKCMFCHDDDITGGPVEIDGDCAWQPVTCSNCGATWNDLYSLSGVNNVEKGDQDAVING